MTAISAVEGYALWAESWDETPSPIVAVEERALAPWIDQIAPCRAVDVGCGTGRWTGRWNALGFDVSAPMLAVAARKTGLAGRLAVGSADQLPVATSSCDAALCALTLGHVRECASAMRELARVLHPGGTLLLTDFHPKAAANGWRRTFRRDGEVYELENYAYTIEDLKRYAPELELVECRDAFIEEPERALFERAGRPELFEAACRMPAVLLSRWIRR